MDLTIAICAYNAAKRLPPMLEALARQHIASGLSWELLVIDNASKDDTAAVADALGRQLSLPLKVVHETKPGLIQARRCAAEIAAGEVLSYVDDDNLVEADWADQCVAFMRAHPRAGIIGGRVDPVFEDPKSEPADFRKRFADALAVRDFGPAEKQLVPPTDDPPCGAGMTGRTSLFRTILSDVTCHLSGRSGKKLTSGEDTEIGLLAHKLGWELWYVPGLKMGHVLPASRLNDDYLNRLIVGGAAASAWLNYLRGKEPPRSKLANLGQWASHELIGLKMQAFHLLRGKQPGSKYAFWRDMHRSQASGYWDLIAHDPVKNLKNAMARLSDSEGEKTRGVSVRA